MDQIARKRKLRNCDRRQPGGLAGTVTHVEHLGDELVAYVDLALGAAVSLKRPTGVDIRVGAAVRVGMAGAHCHLFDTNGMRVASIVVEEPAPTHRVAMNYGS